MFVNNSYSQFDGNHPDLRLCGSPPNYYLDLYNCDSNNFELDNVYLSLTNINGQPITGTCTVGNSQQVYVMLNYTSNASNTPNNCRLFADLIIDNVITPINSYLGNIAPNASGTRQIYGPFTWTCGQELLLNRILIVWRTGGNSAQLASYNCSTYNSAQCELPPNIVIAKPLAVQFTYKSCKVGNNETVYFTSTTNGGTPTYTYAWDFDNNGTTDSTLANPIFTYTTTGNIAKLRVTDSLGVTNTFSLLITSSPELLLSETHTNLGCNGNNSGSIDLCVVGGNSPFTYLWSNGAITQDITGLSAGNYTVTVTDKNGCQKTLSVIILGGDIVSPIVNSPPNLTINGCNTTALSNNGILPFSTLQVSISQTIFIQNGGSYSDSSSIVNITYQDVLSGICPKIINRIFRVTDFCNNVGSASQTINVIDNVAPVISELPTVSTIICPATPSFATATATDLCSENVTLTFADVTTNGTCSGNYSVTRTWTATDSCGNTSTASQTINVIDNVAPVISELPTATTIICPAIPNFATATATDLCSENITLTFLDATTNGTCSGSYSVTRTWTAIDSCGNTSSASQTINVIDNVAPVIANLPSVSTIICPATPSFATATATDLCSENVTLTFADVTTNGTCSGSYSVTRTWTATDSCGNTSTSSQTINVIDNVAPTLVGTLDTNITVSCENVPAIPVLQFIDGCSTNIPNVIFNSITSDITQNGTYTIVRTWNVSDACTNSQTYTQTINVSISNYIQAATINDTFCNSDSTLNVNLNTNLQVLFPNTPVNGVWIDTDNTNELSNGIFTPFELPNGSYTFTYKIVDGNCTRLINIIVPVNASACIVLPCVTLEINNAFSPDGDGINEEFVIQNITDSECYSDNKVEIFNRWGIKVFETENYNNTDKAFRGISEGRGTINAGEKLPSGVYYYFLSYKISDGGTVTKNGYLYMSK